jgi:hypothetical protein
MKDKNGQMRCVELTLCITAGSAARRTIVIDAGKTFQAAALEWFPK